MILSPTNLNIFFTSLNSTYGLAYAETPIFYPAIAQKYPNSTKAWLQGWLTQFEKMRRWNGARVVHTPSPVTYIRQVEPFELTYGIDKFELMYDQHGIYFDIARKFGARTKKWPDYELRDLVEARNDYSGTAAQIGTDGVSHWSASHPVDFWDASKGTYVNDYGASGTSINGITVGGTFNGNSWSTAYVDHASRRDESGEKMGLKPDLTVVPLQLHWEAKTILQNGMFSLPQIGTLGSGNFPTAGSALPANAPMVGALDNPFKGSTDLMMWDDLESVVAWYLFTTKSGVKPFGWVENMAPTMIPRNAPTDPAVFDGRTVLWGSEAVGIPVHGPAFLSSRSGV